MKCTLAFASLTEKCLILSRKFSLPLNNRFIVALVTLTVAPEVTFLLKIGMRVDDELALADSLGVWPGMPILGETGFSTV